MKIHPYVINALTDRPPFAQPGWPERAPSRSRWELTALTIGGILLSVLALLAGV